MSRTLGMGALSEGQEELAAAKSEALWPTVGVCVEFCDFQVSRFSTFQVFRFSGFCATGSACVPPAQVPKTYRPQRDAAVGSADNGRLWPRKRKRKKKKNNRKN